jgi:pSer/pThr/pTyr-binding forkhead associated (FHA) protein
MKAELVFRLGPGRPSRFALGHEEAVLGRDETLAVSLPFEGISRRHARLVFEAGGHFLEDEKSTNGTFLNGRRMSSRERLRSFDVIGLGRKVELVYLVRAERGERPRHLEIVRAALVSAAPDAAAHEVPVGEVTLGRSAASNVVVAHGEVSKLHARLVRGADRLFVLDLGSTNGTFVNGERVRRALLRHGDTLSLGGAAAFTVQIETAETTGTSGAHAGPVLPPDAQGQMSTEWRTRVEWDPDEVRRGPGEGGGAE